MQRNYKLKKTISMKQFISEFGDTFSDHMQQRLLDLEVRSVLTRKDVPNKLNIKHVEHTQYQCNSEDGLECCEREYSFGELVVIDGILYFTERSMESDTVMESSVVNKIYTHLSNDNAISFEGKNLKKVDDTNIDYIIDNILTVCSDVSEEYKALVNEMNLRAATKLNRTTFYNSK